MILSDVKSYLSERKRVSVADLAIHFGVEPGAIRGMLEVWERKGRVRHLEPASGGCSGCRACDDATGDVYVWVERPGA